MYDASDISADVSQGLESASEDGQELAGDEYYNAMLKRREERAKKRKNSGPVLELVKSSSVR